MVLTIRPMTSHWRRAGALAALAALLLLLSCAAGPNDQLQPAGPGFWRGLWHGAIAPITFLVSLFNRNVSVYEVHNGGGWYDFGFLAGMSAVFGSSAARRAAMRQWKPPAPRRPAD